jgi:hypothetical protein
LGEATAEGPQALYIELLEDGTWEPLGAMTFQDLLLWAVSQDRQFMFRAQEVP